MNILDILVIILLLIGAFHGWKYGGFSSIVSLLGTLLVFVLSFYLKNPISTILYENLPFHTFGGIFSGITSFNILVYEGIAYIICLIVLSILLKIVLKLSGLIDKVINLTIVLTIPNKIVGLVCKTLEYYVFIFVGLFVLAQLPIGAPYFKDSTVSNSILKDTPLLSDVTNDIYSSVNEIYDICLKYDKETDKLQADYESLDVLMKYDIITPDSVSKLAERHKLRIDNIDVLIEKYKGEKND